MRRTDASHSPTSLVLEASPRARRSRRARARHRGRAHHLGGAAGDRFTGPGGQASHDVLANLFEWTWTSVAKECTTQLGPAGYAGVQVAPPQDSLQRTETGNGSDTVLHPWWEVYQPTDYTLNSRMGTCSTWMRLSSSPCVIR